MSPADLLSDDLSGPVITDAVLVVIGPKGGRRGKMSRESESIYSKRSDSTYVFWKLFTLSGSGENTTLSFILFFLC